MEHNPVIALFLALAIIIAAARGAGAFARRLNQPRVLGELIAGVILGPTLVDLVHSSFISTDPELLEETIRELAELGVLMLMFKVGLEVHLNELLRVGTVALIAGVVGALLPVAMTVPLVLAAGYEMIPAAFAGVALAATSVSISAQVLIELGLLQTKEGSALLATALIDDVVAILLVSLVVALSGPEGQVSVAELGVIVLRMVAFIGLGFAFSWFVLPRLANYIYAHPKDGEAYGVPAFALIAALSYGWVAEVLGGVAAITGAFIAGVGLSQAIPPVRKEIGLAVTNIAYAFLVPIFFVSIGLTADLSAFPLSAIPFTLALIAAAVVSKVLGCGISARLGGFSNKESLRLGVCMVSRGEVGLIIAALGLSSGVFAADSPLFASLFMVILLSTMLTPPLVRLVFRAEPDSRDPAAADQQTGTASPGPVSPGEPAAHQHLPVSPVVTPLEPTGDKV
ncbi:MAG: cation:proton antiporter [Chloroflexota bacterium]